MRIKLLHLLLALPLWAGQGLVLDPGTRYGTVTSPNLMNTQDWVVEFQVHEPSGGWTAGTSASYIFADNGVGIAAILDASGRLVINDTRDTMQGGSGCAFQITGTSYTNILVRTHRVSGDMEFTCEIWEWDGTLYQVSVRPLTSINSWAFSGGVFGSTASTNVVLDFLRVILGTKAVAGKPPTTYTAETTWTWLKLDGNGTDSSGNAHDATLTSASYEDTPNQVAVSFPKCLSRPVWADCATLDAGDPNQLDGSDSYSLSDTTNTVTYLWSQAAGPTTATWSSMTTAQPTLDNLSFGQYTFNLEVDDGDTTDDVDLIAGAVAQDSNHVIEPSDLNVNAIFGPMIAWGWNPWGYADERNMAALDVRRIQYDTQDYWNTYTPGNPSFDNPQTGTVAYTWNGTGNNYGAACTTLSSGISDTATSIPVTDATCLNLTEFPTYVDIRSAASSSAYEQILICSTTATTGAATLTVCPDGRGKNDASSIAAILGPTTWASASPIGQQIVQGTGTNFLASPNGICPGGIGPAGPVMYSTGTVSLTNAGTGMEGSGTTWNTSNLAVGDAVRVEATISAAPFIFVAYVSAITDTDTIVLNRTFPGDTASGLSYQIIRANTVRNIVTHFTRLSDGSDALVWWRATACSSATQAFFNVGIVVNDVVGYNGGQSWSGQGWSFWDVGGNSQTAYITSFGTNDINFYGEGMAWEALYQRSGLTKARQMSRDVNDHWIRFPALRGGVGGTVYSPLTIGGGVNSAFIAKVLDPGSALEWTDVRTWEALGNTSASSCNGIDTRDSSYRAGWPVLGALYDPDGTANAAARVIVADIYNDRDSSAGLNCKRDDDSFANAQSFTEASINIGLTNGSTAVTGTGLTSGLCDGVGSGTATVTNGSYAITSSAAFPMGMTSLILHGTKDSQPYNAFYVFTRTDASNGTIPVKWQGDSGSITFLARNTTVAGPTTFAGIGTDQNDTANLIQNYGCTFNSSTSLTLDRNWGGSTGTFKIRVSNIVGYFQQPFMQGINATRLAWASPLDATLSINNTSLWRGVSEWVQAGANAYTGGLDYAKVMEFCEADRVDPTAYPQIPGCDSSTVQASHVLIAETMSVLRGYYLAEHNSDASREWADEMYGNIFGYCPWTADGYPCSEDYVTFELLDSTLDNGKWPGFFFGMGMAQQWPAMRTLLVHASALRGITIKGNAVVK